MQKNSCRLCHYDSSVAKHYGCKRARLQTDAVERSEIFSLYRKNLGSQHRAFATIMLHGKMPFFSSFFLHADIRKPTKASSDEGERTTVIG